MYKVEKQGGLFTASVILPSSIDPSLRLTQSVSSWLTERAAKRDAAFQAYVSLHRAKLVNDHLLPSRGDGLWALDVLGCGQTPSRTTPRERHNPWRTTLGLSSQLKLYRHRIVTEENSVSRPGLSLILVTYCEIATATPLTLYWDNRTTFVASLESSELFSISENDLELLQRATFFFLHSARSVAPRDENSADYALLVAPDVPFKDLAQWLDANQGSRSCLAQYADDASVSPSGFIRCPSLYGQPHLFVRWVQPTGGSELHLECHPFPKRKNLLYRGELSSKGSQSDEIDGRVGRVVPASTSRCDSLPWEISRTSLFVPPLVNHIQRLLVAEHLQASLLPLSHPVGLETIADAITCPSAQWPTNYQRLEYLGDSLLKFAVCIQLYHDHPLWHEGYLSQAKNSIVSNGSLTQAALRVGLDKFIIYTPFATRRWRVPTFRVNDSSVAKTPIPSKILADVLEALVGAAFSTGGYASAWETMHRFVEQIPNSMPSLSGRRVPEVGLAIPPELEKKIDELTGFNFRDRYVIWEALTHPSWRRDTSTGSYQRLEFLGDAILDMVIGRRLYQSKPEMTESQMTQIKAALVNGNFLGFLCLDMAIKEDTVQIYEQRKGVFDRSLQKGRLELWRFMRHDGPDIPMAQQSCARRHTQLRELIGHHLFSKNTYPWAILAQLGPDKFFSDIVESVIGAIFVDSGGQIEACEDFLTKLQLTHYLAQVMEEQVRVQHPRAILGRIIGSGSVDYNITRNVKDASLYDVAVMVNGEELVYVYGCRSKDECIVRGADLAVSKLESTSA